jgi:hypothetical protein
VIDDRGHVVALVAATGERRWSRDVATEVVGPLVAAGNDVVVSTRTGLLRFDMSSGAPGPTTSFGAVEPDGTVQVCGTRCLLPLRDGGLQVLDVQNGAPLYRIQTGRKPQVLPLGAGVFVTDDDHVVQTFRRLR